MQQDAPETEDRSLVANALCSITRAAARRPRATLWSVLLISSVCAAATIGLMEFRTDRSDLINPDAEFHQRWITYTESFGDASDLIVVVEAEDPEAIKQVLDSLGSRAEQETDLFSNVLYKIEPGELRRKGLQYLEPQQLASGVERIAEYGPVLDGRWDLIWLDSLLPRLRYQIASSSRENDSKRPALLNHANLLADSLSSWIQDRNDFRSPWPGLVPVDQRLLDGANQVHYLMNDAGTMGFLKAFPAAGSSSFKGESLAIDRMRKLMAEVGADYPHVRLGLTGIPVLESDEMRRSQADMTFASILSFLGVGLLLIIGFRGFRHPLLALVMLAVGMTWAFGYTTLAIGHLNILSVSFAAILVGLGIDFAIHYLSRYLELRRDGKLLRPALGETSAKIGPGIVTGAVTTALAFFCAAFTQFLGVAELGIIAGGGILLCCLATFLVLPALLALADRRADAKRLPVPFQATLLRTIILKYPRAIAGVSVMLIAAIACGAFRWEEAGIKSRVRYDHNLLNLQAAGLESVEVQRRIFNESRSSLLFAVSLADTPEEARRLKRQFEALPSVHHVEELASRLPEFPPEQMQLLVQGIRAKLTNLPMLPSRLPASDPMRTGRALEEFYLALRKCPDPQARPAARALSRFLDSFEKLSINEQMRFLGEYQYRMAAALRAQFEALAGAAQPQPITLEDLPPALTSRFVSSEGKWLIQVYPRDQVWDMEPLEQFVSDVRKVDPHATGTPLQNYEATLQIKQSYQNSALYALAVICLALFADFFRREHLAFIALPPLVVVAFAATLLHTRHIELNWPLLLGAYAGMVLAMAAVLDFHRFCDVALALLPPAGGLLMMFGILGWLDVPLNPANLVVLPLILGIGVDDGVHVLHDFHGQRAGQYRTSGSTINAIILTSLTTIVGFGSMMIAAHRGLYTLGLVLVVGVSSCLFVSVVPLPALLAIASRYRRADEPAIETHSADKNQKPRKAA